MFLPTKFSHLIPKTWKIALVFLEYNFDLDTCGVRPKTLDLNSIYFVLCIPSLSSVTSHVVRWSHSHPVPGRSKVLPVFPPLVAIPLDNTHFWNISCTSDSLVTFRRLINIHSGIKGQKDMRTGLRYVSELVVQARLGKQRFQKEDEWPAFLSYLRSSSSRSQPLWALPSDRRQGGRDHQQRFSSCLECEGNCL